MRLTNIFGMGLLLLLLGSCGKPEPKKYSKGDLSFHYPRDWKIQFDQADEEHGIHIVTLENDDQLMVSISVFEKGGISLPDYVEAQQQSLAAESGLQPGAIREVKRSSMTLAGRPAMEIRYTVGLKTEGLHRARYVEFKAGEKIAIVYLNIPELKWEDVEEGFQQLLESLVLDSQ